MKLMSPTQVVPDPTYGMPKPGIGSFLGVQGNSIFLFGGHALPHDSHARKRTGTHARARTHARAHTHACRYTTLAYPRTATNDMWELQLSTDMTSGTWAPIRTFNTPQV